MMKFGTKNKYCFGDVIIAEVQFTDTFEIKTRPAVVLFEEYGNVVCTGITSNPNMKGISITKKDGIKTDSIIKLNYIFTISEKMVKKFLFNLSEEKRQLIKDELFKKIK